VAARPAGADARPRGLSRRECRGGRGGRRGPARRRRETGRRRRAARARAAARDAWRRCPRSPPSHPRAADGSGRPGARLGARGGVGLAVAGRVSHRAGVPHWFWGVLGTLSVLRSNALGTGWSILSALGGTAVGIILGAGLVLGIGTHETVLWAVLPLAVLLGSYAPRAISFAAGQAGFTVVLFVLFNLIQPTGWRVGLVRLEDVATGLAVS